MLLNFLAQIRYQNGIASFTHFLKKYSRNALLKMLCLTRLIDFFIFQQILSVFEPFQISSFIFHCEENPQKQRKGENKKNNMEGAFRWRGTFLFFQCGSRLNCSTPPFLSPVGQ